MSKDLFPADEKYCRSLASAVCELCPVFVMVMGLLVRLIADVGVEA